MSYNQNEHDACTYIRLEDKPGILPHVLGFKSILDQANGVIHLKDKLNVKLLLDFCENCIHTHLIYVTEMYCLL